MHARYARVDGCLDIDLKSIFCGVVTDTVQVSYIKGDAQDMFTDGSTDHASRSDHHCLGKQKCNHGVLQFRCSVEVLQKNLFATTVAFALVPSVVRTAGPVP